MLETLHTHTHDKNFPLDFLTIYDRIVYFVYFNYTPGVLKTFKKVLPS